MQRIQFNFNREKAIECIIYFSSRIIDPTFHSINKLLYFADKTSLERYGRLICGDDYYAMPLGPVPSHTYDLMKEAVKSSALPFTVNGCSVIPKREANLDVFTESDVESLNKSIELYGKVPFWKRNQDSHDDAYNAAWQSRGECKSVRIPIESIAHLLQDADELIDYLANKGTD